MTAPWSAEFLCFMSLNSFIATAATLPKSPIMATTMEAIAGSKSYPRKAALREGRVLMLTGVSTGRIKPRLSKIPRLPS